MLDRLSVPRRPLDFEDYLDIIRRNVRWLIGPAFAGLVLATVVAYLMEDTFVSHALIRIVPQQVSRELIQNVSAQDVDDRINGMAQTILSRNTLTNLINTYGLYKTELKHEPLEDVVNEMHNRAISIKPALSVTNVSGRNLPAIQVSFSYRDRFLANKVCADLVSRFMNASTQETSDTQVAVNQYLNDELDRTKRDLDAVEQKLADYRSRNAGRLPEQMQTNIQQMNALEQRLSSLNEEATRNSERRMLLDSELRIAKDRLTSVKNAASMPQLRNEKVTEIDREISELETVIAAMKDRYTDSYPDLQAARDRLAVLKKQRDDALKNNKTDVGDNPLIARERADAQGQVEMLEGQLKAATLGDQALSREIRSVNASLRRYQARIESSPGGEREYTDLLRQRDLARQKYEELDAKQQKSLLSMDLEKRKQGETLELLDSASLPVEPTAPKRAMIIPVGIFAGLLVGACIVAVWELKDTSLKNLKDARLYTQLSILGSIPLLENDVVVQRRKRAMWIGWATATIVGLVIMAGSVAHYYFNRA